MMLESNLFPGTQKLTGNRADLKEGVSITDGCIGWEETESLILERPSPPRGCVDLSRAPGSPLTIGPIDIGFPAVQAALSGYSDWPMRVIARRMGAPYTLCEVLLDRFVLDQKLNRANRRQLKVSARRASGRRTIDGSRPGAIRAGRACNWSKRGSTSWTSISAARSKKCSAAAGAGSF